MEPISQKRLRPSDLRDMGLKPDAKSPEIAGYILGGIILLAVLIGFTAKAMELSEDWNIAVGVLITISIAGMLITVFLEWLGKRAHDFRIRYDYTYRRKYTNELHRLHKITTLHFVKMHTKKDEPMASMAYHSSNWIYYELNHLRESPDRGLFHALRYRFSPTYRWVFDKKESERWEMKKRIDESRDSMRKEMEQGIQDKM